MALAVPLLVHFAATAGGGAAASPSPWPAFAPVLLAAYMTSSRGALLAALLGAVVVVARSERRAARGGGARRRRSPARSRPIVGDRRSAAASSTRPATASPGGPSWRVLALLLAGVRRAGRRSARPRSTGLARLPAGRGCARVRPVVRSPSPWRRWSALVAARRPEPAGRRLPLASRRRPGPSRHRDPLRVGVGPGAVLGGRAGRLRRGAGAGDRRRRLRHLLEPQRQPRHPGPERPLRAARAARRARVARVGLLRSASRRWSPSPGCAGRARPRGRDGGRRARRARRRRRRLPDRLDLEHPGGGRSAPGRRRRRGRPGVRRPRGARRRASARPGAGRRGLASALVAARAGRSGPGAVLATSSARLDESRRERWPRRSPPPRALGARGDRGRALGGRAVASARRGRAHGRQHRGRRCAPRSEAIERAPDDFRLWLLASVLAGSGEQPNGAVNYARAGLPARPDCCCSGCRSSPPSPGREPLPERRRPR